MPQYLQTVFPRWRVDAGAGASVKFVFIGCTDVRGNVVVDRIAEASAAPQAVAVRGLELDGVTADVYALAFLVVPEVLGIEIKRRLVRELPDIAQAGIAVLALPRARSSCPGHVQP